MWELSAMTRVQVWAPAAPTLDVSRMFGSVVACISIGRWHLQYPAAVSAAVTHSGNFVRPSIGSECCLAKHKQLGFSQALFALLCPRSKCQKDLSLLLNNGSSHSDCGAIFLTTHHHCDC